MPARIIIDVERSGNCYRAQVVGTAIGGLSVGVEDVLHSIGVWLQDAAGGDMAYSQQDRDIAARIMAEIEGEQ